MPEIRYVRVLALLGVCTFFAACGNPQGPAAMGETVITLGEAEHVTVLDVESGREVARLGPLSRFARARSLSPDSQTLYIFDSKPPGPNNGELIALDMRSLRILWREPWHALLTSPWNGPARPLDGTEILIGGFRNGVRGIMALDSRTRERVGFVGPLAAGTDVVRVPPGPVAPRGTLLVGGTRADDAQSSTGSLFVLDRATLEVRDSIVLVPSSPTSFGGIRELLPAPDGRYAYVVTDNRILRYDLLERRVAADVPLPSRGKLAISPDGRALYLTDHGDGRDYSGSGYLYVFDADLRPRAPIDLREVANTGGQYIQTNAAAVSADGTRVYVAAGSASRGPLFTAQPGRVLVVDAGTGKILKEVPVEGWLTRDIFVR